MLIGQLHKVKVVHTGADQNCVIGRFAHLHMATMGVRKENPMPLSESNQVLAEEFAGFFVDKMKKIQDNLYQYDSFKLAVNESITTRELFLPISELDVHKLAMKMQTKL